MKKIVFLISFVGLSLHAQTNVASKNISNVNYQVSEENVIKTLSYLTSDELEGRDSGSEGIEKAAVYLENLLKENGIKPYFKTYRDTLSNFDKTSYNIVGYIGSKPLHGSQKKIIDNITSLKVKLNYELESLILFYGENITVLQPPELVESIKKRLAEINNNYQCTSTAQ